MTISLFVLDAKKINFYSIKPMTGAAGGDRTHDPWLRRPILYPLSYSRTVLLCKGCILAYQLYNFGLLPSTIDKRPS